MDYVRWREEVFATSRDFDPVMDEQSDVFYAVDCGQHLDHIDRALLDDAVHEMFSVLQIGNGLNLIYSNSCSDLPFCYTDGEDGTRRLAAIRNLKYLYSRFFDRYCTWPVRSVGNDLGSDDSEPIGFLCYMFWDIFVLYEGNTSPADRAAVLEVMEAGLRSENDQSIVSAVHGLGHWALDTPDAVTVLQRWLNSPTTKNPEVLQYAAQATTGIIQ